jgi:hypothetical protein
MIDWDTNERNALEGIFICAKIRQYILENTTKRIVHDTPLLLLTHYEFNKTEEQETDDILYLRNIMIDRALDFQKRTNMQKKKMIIYWFPTPFKKRIPLPPKESLDVEEINSATTFHSPHNFVSIFRREEAPKVLIHELAHFFELDLRLRSTDFGYTKRFKLRVPCLLCETYCEVVAFLLNVEYVSLSTGRDINELFIMERAFSAIQVKKIMDFFTINDINEFNKIRSNTNVFTYYILKTALLFMIDNPNPFINTLEKNGFRIINIDQLKLMIDNGLFVLLDKIKEISQIPIEFKNTMRMTIIE